MIDSQALFEWNRDLAVQLSSQFSPEVVAEVDSDDEKSRLDSAIDVDIEVY